MTDDTDLGQLRRDVQYLLDRTAILDCIARHARGCDRHVQQHRREYQGQMACRHGVSPYGLADIRRNET